MEEELVGSSFANVIGSANEPTMRAVAVIAAAIFRRMFLFRMLSGLLRSR